MENQNIKDKVIIVTGAGSGLGKAVAEKLSLSGGKIILWDVKEDEINKVADQLKSQSLLAEAVLVDVSSEFEVRNGVSDVIRKYHQIDGLINCAGIDITKSIEDLTVSEWDKIVGVDLRGSFLTSKFVYEKMIYQKSGHIINVISTAAKRAWPNASAYHAVKWGLLGFTYALLAEGRKNNIKITAIVPGGMRTPFILERFPDVDPDTLQDPKNVAEAVFQVLNFPSGSNIAEIMVLPMKETSWP